MLAVVIVAAWFALAVGVALGIGGGIRLADRHAPVTGSLVGLPAELTVADILAARAPQPSA
jgi:hypothetical protein